MPASAGVARMPMAVRARMVFMVSCHEQPTCHREMEANWAGFGHFCEGGYWSCHGTRDPVVHLYPALET